MHSVYQYFLYFVNEFTTLLWKKLGDFHQIQLVGVKSEVGNENGIARYARMYACLRMLTNKYVNVKLTWLLFVFVWHSQMLASISHNFI